MRLNRLDRATHDPRVLADLADASEPELLEQLDGPAEEEAPLGPPTRGRLGDRLDEPASGTSDLSERAPSAARAMPCPLWRLSTKMQAMRHLACGGGTLAYSRPCFS